MRKVAVENCKKIFKKFNLDFSKGIVIDVGGTPAVNLDGHFSKNPLLEINPNLIFLDKGFTSNITQEKVDEKVDFLDLNSIQHLQKSFDLVYCFDTLEHAANPFLFCEHLIYIVKPGGYIYTSTVFSWVYHPSPEDYFRFSPGGLRELFQNSLNKLRKEFEIIWYNWEPGKTGVALFGKRK